MLDIKKLLGKNIILFLAVLYSCVITILFFISTSGMPSIGVSHIDKVVHFSIFLGFTFLWLSFLYLRNDMKLSTRTIVIFFLISIIYGTLIEVFQEQFTARRTFDYFDILADMLGSLTGIFVFQKAKPFFNFKNSI